MSNSFADVLAADATKWTCSTCNCKWDDNVLQCKACEIGLKPGVSQADIDAKKNALISMFTSGASKEGAPKPTGFGSAGGAAPFSFGASAGSSGGGSFSFGFGAPAAASSGGSGSSSSGFSFGFSAPAAASSGGTGSSSSGFSFGFGSTTSSGSSSSSSGGFSFGTSAPSGAASGFGASFGAAEKSSSAGAGFKFGSGGDSGGAAPAFGSGGFVFKPEAAKENKSRELIRKRKKALPASALPQMDQDLPCHVYVMGSGECEQLGLGDAILERKKPHMIPVTSFGKLAVTSVAVGGMHTIALTASGLLYSWGCNDDGVLGRTGPENEPGVIAALQEQGVKAALVSCGDCHSAAVDDKGRQWLWGAYKDGNGHIGFPDFKAASRDKSVSVTLSSGDKALKQTTPVLVPDLSGLVMLASGSHHTVALSKGGDLYSWGDNSVAQLGQGDRTGDPPTDGDDKVREQKYQAWKKGKVQRLYPKRLNDAKTFPWPSSERIELVGTTGDCTFVMTSGLETYGCGLNGDYQLGLNSNSEAETKWSRVPALSKVRLVGICGGSSHTVALDSEGKVWCWGKAEFTGHDRKDGAVQVPRQVAAEAFGGLKIRNVSAGGTHTMASAENGDVFSWGRGEVHQLGNVPRDVEDFTKEEKDSDSPPPELSPYVITSGKLKDKFVVSADGGAQHTVVLVWTGEAGKPGKRKRVSLDVPVEERPKKLPRLEISPALLAQCEAELKAADPSLLDIDMSAL